MLRKLLSILCVLFLTSVAMASEKIITISTLEDYSPYAFAKENSTVTPKETIPPGSDSSRLQGYAWDILRESMHEMGYTIELFIAPWARALSMAESGKVDAIFPAGFNEERGETFLYSEEPINRVEFLVYVKPESKIEWMGVDSLNTLTIAVIRDWNFGDEWNANTSIKKHEVNTVLQGFKMLDAGRVDGLVGYEVPFDYALKEAQSKQVYKKLPAFDFSSEFLISNKNNPKAATLLGDFDAGKKKITENGVFDQIVKQWQ